MIEINKTETFIHISSKALTTIPFNIFGGSKCKSTVIQHEMCLLHCNLAAEKQTTLAYIIFFFVASHSFSLQTNAQDSSIAMHLYVNISYIIQPNSK